MARSIKHRQRVIDHGGGLLAMYDVANSTGYGYFYNGNGDVGQVVKHSDGTIGAKYQYDPYGNTIASGGSLNQPWRFSTKQFDDESGLYYNDHRYYGPRWGRWVSREPLGERVGVHKYRVAKNNPLSFVDYLGLMDRPGLPGWNDFLNGNRDDSDTAANPDPQALPPYQSQSESCHAYYLHSKGTYKWGLGYVGHSGVRFGDNEVSDYVGESELQDPDDPNSAMPRSYRQSSFREWLDHQANACPCGRKATIEICELDLTDAECRRLHESVERRHSPNTVGEFRYVPTGNFDNCCTAISKDLRGNTSVDIPSTPPFIFFPPTDSWGELSFPWLRENRKCKSIQSFEICCQGRNLKGGALEKKH